MGSLTSPTDPSTTTTTSLRRRLSLDRAARGGAPPMMLDLPSNTQIASGVSIDVELVSLKEPPMSYTSLKDLIPGLSQPAPMSPAASASTQSWCEIPIRNRLVKQAAWAYLQPMAASPESSGNDLFRRVWARIFSDFGDPFAACLGFIQERVVPAISRAFGWLLSVFWLGGGHGR